ncbi:MAG: hypothetical protein JST33_14095 [Actinobacteria bacterium]|nr:hypothetical protein [Actinomycetota bacterium]
MRHAARRPLHGADRVVAFLQGSIAKLDTAFAVVPLRVNGTLAAGVRVGGELLAAVSFAVEDGRITQVFSVANPDKLAGLEAEARLSR